MGRIADPHHATLKEITPVTTLPPAFTSAETGEANLPLLGAAVWDIDTLPIVRDWLIDGQRDLEIGTPGEWQRLADKALLAERATFLREQLSGWTGRLGVHGPFVGMTIASPDPEIQAVSTKRFLEAAQWAAEVGAKHMVVHSPFVAFGHAFMMPPVAELKPTIDAIHATLDPVVRFAETADLKIVIENIQDTSTAGVLATAASFDSPHLRLSVDVGHAHLMLQRGGIPASRWIDETAPYLAHLHLTDNDGVYDRHWAPGDGELKWYGIMASIARLTTNPTIHLEIHPKDVVRAFDYLTSRTLAR